MNQGKIIEYIDQGRFICTICLQDKGTRLHLLTPSNRQVNLSPKRAVLISGATIDILKPREELLESLNRTEETRNRLKSQVSVKELWELIRDEKESFDHQYLAKLVFGEAATDDHLSALVRALFENRLHFKMKDGRFLPNSEERVKQILRQKEEEALKEEWLKQSGLLVKEIYEGKETIIPFEREDIINILINMALYGTEGPDYRLGKELLSRAGITDIREAKHLLVKLGVWEEDQNLDILRFSIETSFTTEQSEEADRLAGAEVDFDDREDLTHLPVVTIDGPMTSDYDDAMSLEIDGDLLRLGIHIADVSEVILPGSILDREAKNRGSSLYLQRREVPMIPPKLSRDALSLKQGCNRRAISLLADFDRNGELTDFRFVPSVIRVTRKLTYDEANGFLESEALPGDPGRQSAERPKGFLDKMHQISLHLRQARMNHCAVSLSLPELEFEFNADSSLSLKLIDQNTPSRIIVAELMILYNNLAARFCRDNQIPVLFRSQAEPNELLSIEETGYIYYVFRQRRKLSPLRIDTVPKPHSGLGVDIYTQCTSPIRRYLDLVVQRQIKSFILGERPVYNEKELDEIRISVEPAIKTLELVKRKRQRYWVLKLLNQHMGESYKALVLDELKSKYRIILSDFLMTAEIRRKKALLLNPGEEISVVIKRSDPDEDLIELAYADV